MNMRIALIFMLISFPGVWATAQNPYGLDVTNYTEYLASIRGHPEKVLVNLKEHIPGLVLDIRYATTNNFTKEKIYGLARAYARKPVADALKEVQRKLKTRGLGIKIFDAYRPYKATVKFYELYRDTTYVASPYTGSRHNRGCALDLTLIDLKTGAELKMPTEYDAFRKEAWPFASVSDRVARKNRDMLIDIMQHNGFTVFATEWWHFDFNGWENFEVLAIDFEELE